MSKAGRISRLFKDTARKVVTDLRGIVRDVETEATIDPEKAEQVVGGVLVAVAILIGVMEHPLAKVASAALALIGGKLLRKDDGGSLSHA